MDISKDIRYKAKNLLLEYGIGKITLDNLIYIIEQQGFEIIEYSQRDRTDSVWTLLQTQNLALYAESGKAFAYKCGNSRLVFICEEMTADEKLYALAHEEGHIIFGHLYNGTCDGNAIEEEYIANEFAHCLLHPPIYLEMWIKILERKKIAITAIFAIGLLAVVLMIAMTIHRNTSYYGNYFITENGTKYHEEDCMIIKDKSNTRRLTEADYASGEYEPCQVCLPD